MAFSDHKVLVHGPGAFLYMRMFKMAGFGSTDDIDKATVICFTGGADVDPGLYGEKNLRMNGRDMSITDKTRDEDDAMVFGLGLANGATLVGICRGGQFLNVMNGGKMWQHVNGHAGGPHSLQDTITGEIVRVTSTHHQMMRPASDGQILAIARESSFKLADEDEWHIEHDGNEHLDDVEAVWYESSRSLCFQPHPEFPGVEETRAYFFSLLERHLP